MNYRITDFHTHPFTGRENNICSHIEYCDMSVENTLKYYKTLGINRICGSVITMGGNSVSVWEKIRKDNESALELREMYGSFYVPGFHVHPDYVRESCEEIERMNACSVKLVGELCPYLYGWEDYSCKGFDEILGVAEQYGMVVSIHSMGDDAMDLMVKRHPDAVIVAAHPGEYGDFMRHMDRLAMSKNYYVDISGYGVFRHGMLKHAVDVFGAERFLFGSDYPTCNPAMYLGAVVLEPLLNDAQKQMILSENAERLLGL